MKIYLGFFFLAVLVVLSVDSSLALGVDFNMTTPGVATECGWCGSGCGLISAEKACPMIAPPSGKSCVKQGGVCTIVAAEKNCVADSDCGVNEYCYQPPMPVCPTGVVCKMVMPPRVCKQNTGVSVGQACGGLRGIKCDAGLTCEYPKLQDGKIIVDQMGVCVSGQVKKCDWCGLSCGLVNAGMACPMIAPPSGKSCVSEGSGCVIRIDPTPTTVAVTLGDANKDGIVNLVDFSIWKNEYLQNVNVEPGVLLMSDFDKNGKVDLVDFGIWKNAFLGKVSVTGTDLPVGCKWVDVQCIQAPCPRQMVCPITTSN